MTSTALRRKRAAEDERLDLVFHALSDRTRRSLLHRLEQAPANVTELAEPYDMSLPAVSKHIRVLERAGLLKRAIDGRVHRCMLDSGPLLEADRWLMHYRVFWDDALNALTEFIQAEKSGEKK